MKEILGALKNYLGVEDTATETEEKTFNEKDKRLNRGQNISRVAYEQATKIYDSLVDIYQTLQEEPFRFVRNRKTLARLAYRIYCIQIKRDIMFNKWSLQDAQDMYPELEPAVIENLYTANIKTFVQTQIQSKRDEISQLREEIMDALKALPRTMSGTDLRDKINYVVEGYLDVFDVENAIAFAKDVYKETTGLEPPDILVAKGFVHPLLITERTRIPEADDITVGDAVPVPAPRKETRDTRKTSSNVRKDRNRRIKKLKRVSRRYRKMRRARSDKRKAFDQFALNVDIAQAREDTTQQTIDATLVLTNIMFNLAVAGESEQDRLKQEIEDGEQEVVQLEQVLAELTI